MIIDISNYNICIIWAIIILIFIVLYLSVRNNSIISHEDKVVVRQSLIPNSGRGVFANKDFKKGEQIEVCPVISDKTSNIYESILGDYSFTSRYVNGNDVVAFGLCSIYNHSDNYNVDYIQVGDDMIYTANRDIRAKKEIADKQAKSKDAK